MRGLFVFCKTVYYRAMEFTHTANHRLKLYFLLVLAAVNVGVWYAAFAEDRGGKLTVAFLDVGQGDAQSGEEI